MNAMEKRSYSFDDGHKGEMGNFSLETDLEEPKLISEDVPFCKKTRREANDLAEGYDASDSAPNLSSEQQGHAENVHHQTLSCEGDAIQRADISTQRMTQDMANHNDPKTVKSVNDLMQEFCQEHSRMYEKWGSIFSESAQCEVDSVARLSSLKEEAKSVRDHLILQKQQLLGCLSMLIDRINK